MGAVGSSAIVSALGTNVPPIRKMATYSVAGRTVVE